MCVASLAISRCGSNIEGCIKFMRSGCVYLGRRVGYQMEHDRQMAIKAEAEKEAIRKNKFKIQRDALHEQMRGREELQREVRVCVGEGGYMSFILIFSYF